jgi:hypothetical protein
MDIFQFAMEKEKYSEQYYRKLARRAAYPGLKNILTMLANEEAKHYHVVEQMREVEVVLANLGGNRCADPFGRELRSVDADDRQAAGSMACEGVPDPGNRADTVDSAKGPDIEQDDPSAQVREPDGGSDPT